MENQIAVKEILSSLYPQAEIIVEDPMLDDQHLKVTIWEESFAKMRPLERHRCVMSALSERLESKLHAIELHLKPKK